MAQFVFYRAYGGAALGTVPATIAAKRAEFLAMITSPASYGFENKSAGDTPAVIGTMVFGSGATLVNVTMTGSSGTPTPILVRDINTAGRFNTTAGGTNYLQVRALNGDYMQLAFSTPVAAFGFYGTDIGDFGGKLSCVMTRSGGGTDTFVIRDDTSTPSPDQDIIFWGVVDPSATWTTAQLVMTAGSSTTDYFGFDDFVVARPSQIIAPAPAAPPDYWPGQAWPWPCGDVAI